MGALTGYRYQFVRVSRATAPVRPHILRLCVVVEVWKQRTRQVPEPVADPQTCRLCAPPRATACARPGGQYDR